MTVYESPHLREYIKGETIFSGTSIIAAYDLLQHGASKITQSMVVQSRFGHFWFRSNRGVANVTFVQRGNANEDKDLTLSRDGKVYPNTASVSPLS